MKNKISKLFERLMEMLGGVAIPSAATILIFLQIMTPVFGAIQPDRLTQKPRASIGSGVSQNSDLNFDVGLGASNPRLRYKSSDQSMELNKGIFRFGTGAAANQTIEADKGLGATNPKFRYNNSSGKWEFSNDGTIYAGVGSGGGGGGGGFNLLTNDDNFGFEDGANTWVASGGAFTADLSTPIYGLSSGVFDASSLSQTLSSSLKAVVDGLKGTSCLAAISYRYAGTSGDYKLQVYDGSTVLSELSLVQSVTANDAYVGFGCPSSGSVQLRIIAAVANPGAITLDGAKNNSGNVQLGSNILLAQINNSEFYGSATSAGVASCVWSSTTNATFGSYSADTDCSAPSLKGKATAPATKIPAIKLDSLPPGEYLFVANGSFNAAGGECSFRFSDGTNSSTPMRVQFGGIATTVSGHLSYTTTADRVIELQGTGTLGGVACEIYAATAVTTGLEINAYKYPTASQSALQGIDTSGWFVSANLGGANIVVTQDASNYNDLTNGSLDLVLNSGSIGAQVACSTTNPSTGLTCSAGGESLGIAFDIPKVGAIQACVTFNAGNNSACSDCGAAYKLVETSNTNAATIIQEAGPKVSSHLDSTFTPHYTPHVICGTFNIASVGKHTFRVLGTTDSASGLVFADRSTSNGLGGRDISFYAAPINQQSPMPLLVKQLQSTSTAVMQHATAYISNSGSPSILRQDGSWLSSVTDNGAGDVSINIAASVFSATPNCTCEGVEETADTSEVNCSVDKTTAPSASVYRFRTRLANTLTDRDFIVSCTAAK